MKTSNLYAFRGMNQDFEYSNQNQFSQHSNYQRNENLDPQIHSHFNTSPSERLRVIKFLTYESSHGFSYNNTDINNFFGFQGIHPLDEQLIQHSRRVSELCVRIGKAMGLDKQTVIELKIAGMLHDIGKVYVPSEIINKPEKLDQASLQIVRTHTLLGYEILKGIKEYKNIAKYARSHHERIDGKGYPDGLVGDNIPLGSRIIAVADAYEAMTESRPYRASLCQKDAIKELVLNAGTQFDANIVNVFIEKVL